MRVFSYEQPKELQGALSLLQHQSQAMLIAGGTNLIDLMKLEVMNPTVLVDITRLPLRSIDKRDNRLIIGALALNSDVARHPLVAQNYPLLAEALLAGASPQLRNMATIGGNLLQRTRCPYFNDRTQPCNKRDPGSGCSALQGFQRTQAILGTSSQCIATHPSDMAVALNALDATVVIAGPQGERRVPVRDFHVEPGNTPQKETVLHAHEIVTAVELPEPIRGQRSRYVKVRDRASYAFALASAAALLVIEGQQIRLARLSLGGIATRPWQAVTAEKFLVGARAENASYMQAAEAALEGAQPRKGNAFKVELAKRTIRRALQEASSGQSWG